MKKFPAILLLTSILLLFGNASFARQAADNTYPVILQFYSIGTGTPGKEPLEKFIAGYRRQHQLPRLRATLVSGLGREGEYAVLLPLKELKAGQQKKFIAALSKALPTLRKKGEAGGINLTQNEPFDTNKGRVKPQPLIL